MSPAGYVDMLKSVRAIKYSQKHTSARWSMHSPWHWLVVSGYLGKFPMIDGYPRRQQVDTIYLVAKSRCYPVKGIVQARIDTIVTTLYT
jgi:hypothetical protein